jgi:DinB family protein
MRRRLGMGWGVVVGLMLTAGLATDTGVGGGEYAKHFGALRKLSVEVAQAMPAEEYGFKPHSESMNFGELMGHIATTNYQFSAGLQDVTTPELPSPKDKDGYVKFLSDSFEYCGTIIPKLTDAQMSGRTILQMDGYRDARCCWRCTCTWRIIAGRRRFICETKEFGRRDTGFKAPPKS